MATLLLAAAGSAIGGAIGGSVLGVSAAVIGQAVGAAVGQAVDARLLSGAQGDITREGPRLDTLDVMTAREGAPLPELWGRLAVSGEVIWAARLEERIETDRESVGSGKRKSSVTTKSFVYYASFAVSLGEGPIAGINRVWADGRLLDAVQLQAEGRLRVYRGTETQTPDPLIAAKEGGAPAFRGTAYVVFEDLLLSAFGNRVPQIKVELWGRGGDLEPDIRGVCMIPGTTEWGYSPDKARRVTITQAGEVLEGEPMNVARGPADWEISLDVMGKVLPSVDTVSLVVAWFGTDLRAGQCEVIPKSEFVDRDTRPVYGVAGLFAGTDVAPAQRMQEVSRDAGGRPAFGSAPADISVVRAIEDLKARGYRVVLYPFLMMDVRATQGLPQPTGGGTQPDYPWRGRIRATAGQSVGAEIAAFLGTAAVGDFIVHPRSSWEDGTVVTAPGADFGFRRFILHLAHLAEAAGGVDAFLIGSELRGLTFSTPGGGVYPFVDGLVDLAADVASVLPSAQISYAADWSEYHSHRPDDGSGDVYFHLDPLWSSGDVDFVAIDNYLPLSDWRDGTDHLDAAVARSPYDLDYLKGNVEGGEYWDWFYASDADRTAQIRTPIVDTAHGELWVFRQKAIRDWWSNTHRNRPGGVRASTSTGWVAASKPVWFSELGCPAVDLGSNQPNVFVSRLSSESFVPYFSSGARDDYIQRQYLRAMLEWWADNGGSVLSVGDIQIWAWDARPYPEFPRATFQWSDGPDWTLGHWLTGRAGAAPVREMVRARLAERHGLSSSEMELTHAHGQADGYPVAAPITFRQFLQPLEVGLGVLARETGGRISVELRDYRPAAAPLDADGLVDTEALFSRIRGDLVDAPRRAVLAYRSGSHDYESSAALATIGAGVEVGVAAAESPLVLDADRAQVAVTRLLRAASEGREELSLTVPRSATDLEPGAVVEVSLGSAAAAFVVQRATDSPSGRALELASYPAGALRTASLIGQNAGPATRANPAAGAGSALLRIASVPLIADRPELQPWDSLVAAHAAPWPGPVALALGAAEGGPFTVRASVDAPGAIGETLGDLDVGRPWLWDEAAALEVALYAGGLVTRDPLEVLDGANMLALAHADGWEVAQFRVAEPIAGGARRFRLRGLLRGQRGTEWLSESVLPQGASVVVLDGAAAPALFSADEARRALWLRSGPASIPVAEHAVRAVTPLPSGYRPFRPAALRADADGGDTVLSWLRRTRLPVEGGLASDPVFGDAPRWRVEVGPEGAPVRVVEVTEPGWTYAAAEKVADGVVAPFRVAVSAVNDEWGVGPAAALIVEE